MALMDMALKTDTLDNKKLHQLHPEMENTLIVAMVLTKAEPNIFLAKNDTQYRGVMTYTLRDSKQHIVNCTYWGSRERVEESNKLIQLGDIVDVVCPKITALNSTADAKDSKHAQFRPLTSLPFLLVLNEGQGFIQKHSYHDLENYAEIKKLANQSHKPLYSVMNLSDVRSSFSDANTQTFHTDFLVAVGLLRSPREIRSSKDGRPPRHCLEVVVFDQSLPSGMTLTIWHKDWIERAQQHWQPMKTVLHLIDVKVSFSEFYKACILGFNSRSIIYENPMGQESWNLLQYAGSIVKPVFDRFTTTTSAESLPKPNEIQTIMTVRQIYTRAEGRLRDNSEQFTAALYAMITKFDVESQRAVVQKRCKACKRFISHSKNLCDTEQCQLTFSFGHTGEKFEYFFNMNLHCSDHTGTLVEARLTEAIAARILGKTCEEYLHLNDGELEKLRDYFLLNHFEVKLLVKKANDLRRKLMALIIDMRRIELNELAQNIAVF